MSTDKEWEKWGKQDPYYGVLTDNRYRTANLDEARKQEFFATGNDDIARVVSVIKNNVDPAFAPRRALDFGCGTGRLAIPLAEVAHEVVGMDISESMLAEAAKNALAQKMSNIAFVKSDDELSQLQGSFDFIHSYIVFQHIPIKRGIAILQRLVDRLAENGVGAIHLVYNHDKYLFKAENKWVYQLRRCLGVFKRLLLSIVTRPDPFLEMNRYPLATVFLFLQHSGVRQMHVEFVDDAPYRGVYLFFKKQPV